MRNSVFAFIVIFLGLQSSDLSAQISFTKGNIIKKSYVSTTMVAPPVLGKSSNGFFILSSGLMSAKKIVQLNLDKEMNQSGEEIVVKLPKGKALRRIFNNNNAMIVVLWSGKKSDPFEIYNYDFTKSALGILLQSIPVDDYPGREELEISLLNEDFQDFLGFVIRPKVEYSHVYRKVVVTDRRMDQIVWSQVIIDPYVESRERLGEFRLSDLYFNDAHTLVTRFTRPFLKEDKEEIQTDMFHFKGNSMENVWHDQVIRSTANEEFRSLPLPYISKNDKIEVYYLSCETASGKFDLVKEDISGDEIERFELSSEIDNLKNVKRIGIYGFVMPVNNDFEDGSFCFLISEQLKQIEITYKNMRTSLKHCVVSFNIDETGISDDHVINAGYIKGIWGELDGNIILSNSLDVIINGEMISTDQTEVFERFVQVTKRVQPGTTFHYVINDELYSFHSEYATGNMTSQLVKWNFE
jgi:hypothetical protein